MIRLRPSGADEVLIKRVRDWYEPGPGVFIQSLTASFSPAMLFTTGVNGVWYDPSDMTTLFQDAAGATPVTAVEQPVGLMLDKSKGLALGSELMTNGDFSDGTTGWTLGAGWNISGGAAEHVVGNSGSISQTVSAVAGRFYEVSFNVMSIGGVSPSISARIGSGSSLVTITGTGQKRFIQTPTGATLGSLQISASNNTSVVVDNISVRELPGNHAFNASGNSANFPVLSARYNQYLSTETLATQNVTTVAASYKLAFTGTGSITLSGTATGTYSAGTHTITCTAGTLTSTVSGAVTQADLRVSNDALNQPAYQRVNTSSDYDTVGFKPYLKFNGTNQWLQTNSIDFTYGNKMFVSAGVRKLSDAAIGMIAETSVNATGNNGAFFFSAPTTLGAGTYRWVSRGTATAVSDTPNSYAAPIASITTCIGDISGDSAILRVNGTQAASSTADQGTGNYGNYPLYIGARAGTSLWFNGRLYQLVVAGKQASAAEITNTEAFTNQKTGAY